MTRSRRAAPPPPPKASLWGICVNCHDTALLRWHRTRNGPMIASCVDEQACRNRKFAAELLAEQEHAS